MIKSDTKNEDVAKIVHDLKTPIAAQIAALESFLYTTSKKLEQEEIDLIELTLNSCHYMQNLVDNFNLVQKLSYEELVLNYEKFDIVDLIDECINELKILLKYYNLEISFLKKQPIIIEADKLQIKRVVDNLLSNSIKYAFENTKIEIEYNCSKSDFLFQIKNKSFYISPSILKEIFEKYKTCSNLCNKNSVGLGLYLSNEIIRAHLGVMFARNYEEDSVIFGFKIPLS